MKTPHHFWILILLLVGLILMYMFGVFSIRESFAGVQLSGASCPPGYKFFNDKMGDSFCCKGRVDPYTHKCLDTNALNDICAFSKSAVDPRNRGLKLPLCADMMQSEFEQYSQSKCPKQMRYYATDGNMKSKCCTSPSVNNGQDCSAVDLADKSKYCVVSGNLAAGEQYCKDIQMDEAAGCPTGFNKTTYTMGEREVHRYGGPARGLAVPVCYNLTDSCIPDNVIYNLQDRGIFKEKDVSTWKWSCTTWNRVNKERDQTFTVDESYP